MKLSIIIPIFNMERYIQKCINSILEQNHFFLCKENIEILLINDGSTDSSFDLIKPYEKQYDYIKIYNKLNGGLSDARNFGIEKSSGDYIWFIDSDDWIDSNSLNIIFNELESNNLDVLEFDFAKVYESKNNIVIKKEPYYSQIRTEVINGYDFIAKYGYIISVTSKVIKRTLFINNKITFPLNRFSEDAIPALKLMLKSYNYKKISQVLYYYYNREGSITNSKEINKIITRNSDILINIKEAINLLKEEDSNLNCHMIYEMFSFLVSNIILSVFKQKINKDYLYEFIGELKKLNLYPIQKYRYYKKSRKRDLFRLFVNNTILLRFAAYILLPTNERNI